MTEMLFLIMALFVAYVLYVIVNEKKGENQKSSPVSAAKQPEAPAPDKAKSTSAAAAGHVEAVKTDSSKPVAAKAAPKTTAAKKMPAPKPAAAKPEIAKSATPAAAPKAAKSKGLKDPRTGEVVSSYSNYRFTKRWIKEALVAEGLVDKIYKNDELTPAIEANIKSAIGKLEANKKYQP